MVKKFKEFFKTKKDKTKERFLNLFKIDATDIDEVLWDIRDDMEINNIKYTLTTPSSTLPILVKDSKFKINGDKFEYYPLNILFSDAYQNRQNEKYLFYLSISFTGPSH